MDKTKAFRAILLCEAFLGDIINILNAEIRRRGEDINFAFEEELGKILLIDKYLSNKLPRNIELECIKQVKKALKFVTNKKGTPAEYIATLLDTVPFAKLYLNDDMNKILDEVISGLLDKCGKAIDVSMLNNMESHADMYLSKVFKDYKPIGEEINV